MIIENEQQVSALPTVNELLREAAEAEAVERDLREFDKELGS